MKNSKFVRKFRSGEIAENLVKKVLIENGIEILRVGKGLEWDFEAVIPEKSVAFFCEVKYDEMSARTGNIAIEFYNCKQDKPSGIEATEAHLWFYVLPDLTIWVASVTLIKDFISKNPPFKLIKAGGDDNANLYIYKKDFILGNLFQKVENNISESLLSLLG